MKKTTLNTIERDYGRLQSNSAEELLTWAEASFGTEVTLACSFGAEDVVLLDLITTLGLAIPCFVLDTGRLHEETYEVMQRCRIRYGINFIAYFPRTELVQDLVRQKGSSSFYESSENRKECCGIRKVEPLNRALEGKSAWITGLRRDQSVTRLDLPKVGHDDAHGGILKISPLADWSDSRVWDYIRSRDVPYNKLHDRGFPSIGCAPCTRAIQPGDDIRAGRWWWEQPEHKECGLHGIRVLKETT